MVSSTVRYWATVYMAASETRRSRMDRMSMPNERRTPRLTARCRRGKSRRVHARERHPEVMAATTHVGITRSLVVIETPLP
eukprot:4351167-Pyramimonas_sp.AAC.1